MAKNEKTNREDEIRVVEDAEGVQEEVVRLDPPKQGPVGRKMASAEDRSMSNMMGDIAEVEEVREAHFDPETAWLDGDGTGKAKSIPVGWFVLFGLALAGVVFWVVTQRGPSSTVDSSLVDSDLGLLGKIEEQQAIDQAAEEYAAMEDIVTRFFAADTIEEMVKYVRDPERVLPLMKDYYQRVEIETFVFEMADEYHIVSLENFPFIALSAGVEGGKSMPLLLEDGPEGVKVDWESFVCYQPMAPETFLSERPIEPLAFRVYVQRDDFYAFDFADESKFACYKLTFRGSDVSLFGYVERGTQLDVEIQKIFGDSGGKLSMSSLILGLSFLPDSRAPNSVKIHDLRSKLWAYPSLAGGAEGSVDNQ